MKKLELKIEIASLLFKINTDQLQFLHGVIYIILSLLTLALLLSLSVYI
jgi:hypothetical protein